MMLILQQPLTNTVFWNVFHQTALLLNSAMLAMSNTFEESYHL